MRRTVLACAILTTAALVAAGLGCGGAAPDPRTDDSPTFGHVLFIADEDARPVLDPEKAVFESVYSKAQLDIRYLSEADLLKAMLNDSVRCVISTVAQGADQQAYFAKRHVTPPSVPIYTDAIAVVVNKACRLEHLSVPELRRILDVQVSTDMATTFMPLFPSRGSGIARALADSLHLGNVRGQAMTNVDGLIARVAADPMSIGLLSFACISDLDDAHVRALREQVRLLPIALRDSASAVLPNQSTLADGRYPLRRTVSMLLTEGKSGLGTGFVSFVANHKGQRIILKLGVAPIKVPSREVEIVHE